MKALELTGMKVGRLTVVGPAAHEPGQHRNWTCMCECGNTTVLRASQVKSGSVLSCGCYRTELKRREKTKHGLYYHSAYATWSHMMQRCHNEKSGDYPEYGARGITVAPEWHDPAAFIAYMGERPVGASIDRIDNSLGYAPGNCRWATPTEQANNTRRNRFYEHDGKRLTVCQWERELGINHGTLWARLKRGVPFEEAISKR